MKADWTYQRFLGTSLTMFVSPLLVLGGFGISLLLKSQSFRYPAPACTNVSFSILKSVNHKILTLRYVAYVNQPRYGNIAYVATSSTSLQIYAMYPVIPVSATISAVASIGRLSLKNSGIQMRLRASWIVYRVAPCCVSVTLRGSMDEVPVVHAR